MSDDTPIVGIDLGTTNSAVAYFVAGKVRVLPNALGEALTPSVVALDERSGALVVGRTAKDIYTANPQLGAALFKRGMGSELKYTIAGARYGAVDLSALVLRALRRDAVAALGEDVTRCVITVPAYFNEAQRFATMKAGELAGFAVERILNEPTAAAIAHGLHRAGGDGTLVVIDLGGGTFDVCVMDRFDGALEVRSVAGEGMLGGEDFTRTLAALALARAGLTYEQAEIRDVQAIVLLTKRAELLKRRLSEDDRGAIVVPPFRHMSQEPREIKITREEAQEAFAPLLERLVGPCRGALRGAGLNRTDVDDVVLVGGATRMPAVRTLVERLFERPPREGVDPDLAIVHGAAIQAALAGGDLAVSDMVVTDVASHSLGTDVSKFLGGQHISGFFSPIIHRNSVIPTSQSRTYYTLEPHQTEMRLDVYEGEGRYVKDNRFIGTLVVKGIPRGPEGKGVDVRFTFDLNGMLEVEATVVDTSVRVNKVFHRSAEALTDEQIEQARARLARIKEDPRERSMIRDVIGRAEGLLTEVEARARMQIEQLLDALDDALRKRDLAEADELARALRAVCDDLDGGERW